MPRSGARDVRIGSGDVYCNSSPRHLFAFPNATEKMMALDAVEKALKMTVTSKYKVECRELWGG